MKSVYLDNAATTRMEPSVMEKVIEVMRSEFGNPSSIHAQGRKARTLIESARKKVAEILNASTGEIFFTSSATESNNMALLGAVRDLKVKRIVTSPTEHPCVLNCIDYLKEDRGVEVEFVKVDHSGNVNLDEIRNILQQPKGNTLLSIMHGNNEIGTVSNMEAISEICEETNTLFHCDAVQTIGKRDLDLTKYKVNFLSGSGHKIYGPKGVGIIYINQASPIKAMILGGGQERRIRSGTENVYGIVGFAEALSWLYQNRSSHNSKTLQLRNYFKEQLSNQIPGIQYRGNQKDSFLSNILSTALPKTPKTELAIFNLDIMGICASAGSACSSGADAGSHVIAAIGGEHNTKTLRFSFSHINTKEELDYTVEKLRGIVGAN